MKLKDATCWIVTDGKAGDDAVCLGIADALGLEPEMRVVAPRAPWLWLMPWGPVDPAENSGRPGSPIAPPFPDLLIATGRRAVAYLRAVRRQTPDCFTVFLKDPRTDPGLAHFIWAFEHDRIAGGNVFKTLTGPHRLSSPIAAAREKLSADILALPQPRVTILLGGSTGVYRYTGAARTAFAEHLAAVSATGASFLISVSRRTERPLYDSVMAGLKGAPQLTYDGRGDNPYVDFLAAADALIVTADSANMLGEACATGRPVFYFEGKGRAGKFRRYIAGLERTGAVHPFVGDITGENYRPIDSTSEIAGKIFQAYKKHRAARTSQC